MPSPFDQDFSEAPLDLDIDNYSNEGIEIEEEEIDDEFINPYDDDDEEDERFAEDSDEDDDGNDIDEDKDEDNSEDKNEEEENEIEDNKEEEYEDWTYPDFIPDELVAPEPGTMSAEEELEWYRKNYIEALDRYKSEDFAEELKRSYTESLLQEDESIDEYRMVKDFLRGNPELAIKTYAPNFLISKGHDPRISEEQKNDLIAEQLAKEFGEDYQMVYNQDDANNPNTISGKMWKRNIDLSMTIDKHNEKISADWEAKQQANSPEMLEKRLNIEYERDWKEQGFTKEEFTEFADKAINFLQSDRLSMSDIHMILNKQDYLDEMYEKGVKDGKKSMTKELERAGAKAVIRQPANKNGQPYRNTFDHLNPGGKFVSNPMKFNNV